MLCPAAERVTVNSYLEGLGYGPDTFSVLVLDTNDKPIYYICNWNIEDSDYAAISSYLDTKSAVRYTGQLDKQILNAANCRIATIDEV
jgi:hypothetical protein